MNRTILVADDSRINRRVLSRMLCEEYTVLEAEDGRAAMQVLEMEHHRVSAVLLDLVMPEMDGYAVLERMQGDPMLRNIPVIVTTGSTDREAEKRALALGANDFMTKPYDAEVLYKRLENLIRLQEASAMINTYEKDRLTGLWNTDAFYRRAAQLIAQAPEGSFVLGAIDIDGFKVVNDQYGADTGNRVLETAAEGLLQSCHRHGGICGRVYADRFICLYPIGLLETGAVTPARLEQSITEKTGVKVTLCVGRYIVEDKTLGTDAMYDRACIAKATVKGRFDAHIAVYDESMRDRLVRDQAVVNEMNAALSGGQFEVWFQPQYDYATEAMIGAEALVRWRHPVRGLIPSGEFIELFEKNGFIYRLDRFVWERVCVLLRKWIDEGRAPLPVSVNISRYDVFRPDLVSVLVELVERYRLPIDLMRLEITESAFSQSAAHIVEVVKRLLDRGFTVEIDDFGSGYSSLNTLKDVPAQIVKLDMKFLESGDSAQRGGSIIESIVRMAKWIDMSVIAEGVETRQQAEFLSSIGCNYMQGYLFAMPMPTAEYETFCRGVVKEERLLALETVENLDNNAFWSPDSMDTLIFNSYVGAACIFEYQNGRIELLRLTERFTDVAGHRTTEKLLKLDWNRYIDEENRAILSAAVTQSMTTQKEASCEIVLLQLPNSLTRAFVRCSFRVIARAGDRLLVYCVIEDRTAQREAERKEREAAAQMQAIMENMNGGISAAVMDGVASHYIFANEQFYTMLGYTQEQFDRELPDGLASIIEPEDLARVNAAVAKNERDGGHDLPLEFRIRRRDGTRIWMHTSGTVCRFDNVDKPVHIAVHTDITAAKEAEKNMLAADDQLRFLNEVSGDLLAQQDAGKGIDGVLTKILTFFGADRAYVFEIDADSKSADNTYEVCAPGVTSERENLQKVPLSHYFSWIEAFDRDEFIRISDVSRLPDERAEERGLLLAQNIRSLLAVPFLRDGVLAGFVGLDNPTRQIEKAERLLALSDYLAVMITRRDLVSRIESESRSLHQMMNDIPGGFVRMRVTDDGSSVPVFFNDGILRLTGMTREQCAEQYASSSTAGVHPDDLPIVERAVSELLTLGETRSPKYRLRTGGGGWVWVRIFGRMTGDAAGGRYFNIYYTDVSEQEQKALSERDMLSMALTSIMQETPDLAFVKDAELRYVFCSRQMAVFRGLTSASDMIGRTDAELMPPQTAARNEADDRRVLESGQAETDITFGAPDADGQTRWYSAAKYPLHDSFGAVIGIYGVGRDVTEERTNNEHLKLLNDNLPVGLAKFSVSRTRLVAVYLNDGFFALSGYTRAEYAAAFGQDPFAVILSEDVPAAKRRIAEALDGADRVEFAFRIRRKKGERRWVNLIAVVDERRDDSALFNIVMVDVTEEKTTVEAVRVREQEIRIAMSQMGKMICEYDVLSGTLTLPDRLAERYRSHTVIADVPDAVALSGLIDEAYVPAYYRFFDAILRGEENGVIEYQGKWANGDPHWLRMAFSSISDSTGVPVKAIIAVEDTTAEHDESRRTALERERMYTALANLIPMAISVNLSKNSYYMISYNAYTTKAAPSQGVFDTLIEIGEQTVPEPDRQKFHDAFARENLLRAYARNKRKVELEHRQMGDDGKEHWILTQVFFVDNPFDSDILEVTIARDITEQKRFETQLQKTYDLTIENMPDFVAKWWFKDGDVLLLDANRKYLDFMGVTADETIGKSIFTGMPEADKAATVAQMYACMETRAGIAYTGRMFRRSGEPCFLTVKASYFGEKDGCPVYYGTLTEVTELLAAQEALRLSREEYRIAMAMSNRTVFHCDIRTRVLNVLSLGDADKRFSVLDGQQPEALIHAFRLTPESAAEYRRLIKRIEKGKPGKPVKLCSLDAAEQPHWAELEYHIITDMDGKPVTAIISVEIITEKLQKEAVYKRWQQSINERDPREYTLFSRNISSDKPVGTIQGRLLNLTPADVPDKPFCQITRSYAEKHVAADDRAAYIALLDPDALLASFRRGTRTKVLEYRERRPRRAERWLRLTVELVEYPNQKDVEAYLLYEDIDSDKREQLRIRQKAELDPLTGALNRATFAARADALFAVQDTECALLFLDIDGFKQINDTLGHAAGDEALVFLSGRLRNILRPGDLIGRFGGDEFLALLQGMGRAEAIAKKAQQVCDALRRDFENGVTMSVSMGIAIAPRDGTDFDTVCRHADAALYAVKGAGKNGFAFYSSGMEDVPDTHS